MNNPQESETPQGRDEYQIRYKVNHNRGKLRLFFFKVKLKFTNLNQFNPTELPRTKFQFSLAFLRDEIFCYTNLSLTIKLWKEP